MQVRLSSPHIAAGDRDSLVACCYDEFFGGEKEEGMASFDSSVPVACVDAGGEVSRKRKASSVDDEEDGDGVSMEIADEHANGLPNGHMNGDRSALSPHSKEGPADGKGKKRAKEKQKEEKEEGEGEEYLFSSKQQWFRPLAATSASVPSASAPPPVVTEQHPFSAPQPALPPQQQQEQVNRFVHPTIQETARVGASTRNVP